MSATRLISLVDYLAYQAGCEYISDLRCLDSLDRRKLARMLEKVEPDDFPLRDWNDALNYLVRESPQQTAREAQTRPILLLVSYPHVGNYKYL